MRPNYLKINAIKNNHWLLSTAEFADQVSADWFDASFWRKQNGIIGESHGRNVTYFCRYTDPNKATHEWVLRHYYRGGFFGKLVKDQYRFASIKTTRVFRELNLLSQMQKMNLPAPKPIAGEIIRDGWAYRANILIEKIPHATDVFALLSKKQLSNEQWQQIGSCIKQFHNQQVYHSDLNIHNIMLDKNDCCFLIDFDKSEIRQSKNDWKKSNLDRLLRSLKKELEKNPSFQFKITDWQALLTGYHE